MASGQAPAKKTFTTRKKSLRFYRSQKQVPPPSFLNDDTQEEQKSDLQGVKSVDRATLNPSPEKPLVITMSKKSIFLFFFIVALVAILCFAAGFLVSYLSFGPKPIAATAQKAPIRDGKVRKTALIPDARVARVFFSLELATSDDLETAQQMLKQLKDQKLNAFLNTAQDDTGRAVYLIRAGKYGNYTDAHRALQKLPKPFSLWGKVVRIERHVTQP
ncbi:MAG: SPOR domain-containing protein [Pseudomonadota bacterium]